jgi:hypothetical protein
MMRFMRRRHGLLLFLALVLQLLDFAVHADELPVWRYRVRPGDNLSSLAQIHLQEPYRWNHLVRYNKLSHSPRILIGQELRFPVAWLTRSPAAANLIHVSGDVQMSTTQGIWKSAQAGVNLYVGQALKVGPGSSARIQFADDSVLWVQPNTTIALDALSVYANGHMADTKLRLQSGRVEIKANPLHHTSQPFEVITPAAVTAVRGTHFMVSSDSSRTLEHTYEGLVALQSSQGLVLVPKGYGSSVMQGKAPATPTPLIPTNVTPILQTTFKDLPVSFSLHTSVESENNQWVMQLGRDADTGDVFGEQISPHPLANWGALRNGTYYFRFWQLDANRVPSIPAVHRFEVAVVRELQGAALLLAHDLFKSGVLELNLPVQPKGRRYWLELTQDAEGNKVIWQGLNAQHTFTIPQPLTEAGNYHLWIWTMDSTKP